MAAEPRVPSREDAVVAFLIRVTCAGAQSILDGR
jgi:hypothetical protein